MSANTLLLALSIFTGILLFVLLWPYILILVGMLTLVVCVAIVLVILVIGVFVLLQFLLIPYYAMKSKEYIETGNYSINDAKEPGERHDGNKEI